MAQNQVRVIPYEGYLRVAGELGDISIPMRFTLYDADDTAVWSEEYSATPETKSCDLDDCSVAVIDGRFSVGLGQYETSLVGLDWSQEYRLGIELEAEGAWFDLDNRERLAPVPWSFLAETATNLAADGQVTVNGHVNCSDTVITAHDLDVSGSTSVDTYVSAPTAVIDGNADVEHAVRVSGDVSTTAALRLGDRVPVSLASGDQVVTGEADELVFDSARRLDNGIDIGGSLTVGTVEAQGGVDAAGSLTMQDWSIASGRNLFRVVWVEMSGFTYGDTNVDYDQYWCVVGGMWIQNGRLSGSSSSELFFYNTYERDDGDWGVESNVPHHSSDAETHKVGVICVQRQAAVVPSDWFQRFETFP